MKKKIIYIAHPISGNVEYNLDKVKKIARWILLMGDVVPIAPHYLYCHALDDHEPAEREIGMACNREILESGIVDELWLFGDHVSEGMATEVIIALREGIEVVPMSEATKKFYKST